MTTKHTLYIANVNKDVITALLRTWNIDATVYESQSLINELVVWGVVVEIMNCEKSDVVEFAGHVCNVYNENCVLLTSQRLNAELVNGRRERTAI